MSYYFDLDGTLFEHGTNTPLPGAVDMLAKLRRAGAILYITTLRGNKFLDHPVFNPDATAAAVEAHFGIMRWRINFDSPSPRVIVNDSGAGAHNHVPGASWTDNEINQLIHREYKAGYSK